MKTFITTTLSSASLYDTSKSIDKKRYHKMLAAYGEFVHPSGSGKMILDKVWANNIVESAVNGPIKLGNIPIPLGHPKDSIALAKENKGWLVELEALDDGLYGVYELRDDDTIKAVESGLIKDVSVAFVDYYVDKKTGKRWKDVLLHVGLVNDPFIKGMTPAKALSDDYNGSVYYSDEHNLKDKETNMPKVKNNYKHDLVLEYDKDGNLTKTVLKPGSEVEVPDTDIESVNNQVAEQASAGLNNTDDNTKTTEDVDAVEDDAKEKEMNEREAELVKKEKELNDRIISEDYKKLLSEGRIVPAQKESFFALSGYVSSQNSTKIELSDKTEKTVAQLLSDFINNSPSKIELGDEKGLSGQNKNDVTLTEEEKNLTDFGVTEEELLKTKEKEKQKNG